MNLMRLSTWSFTIQPPRHLKFLTIGFFQIPLWAKAAFKCPIQAQVFIEWFFVWSTNAVEFLVPQFGFSLESIILQFENNILLWHFLSRVDSPLMYSKGSNSPSHSGKVQVPHPSAWTVVKCPWVAWIDVESYSLTCQTLVSVILLQHSTNTTMATLCILRINLQLLTTDQILNPIALELHFYNCYIIVFK